MPRQSAQAMLAPGVLAWAMRTSGWTVKEVAEKLRVEPSQVEAWEGGASAVSITQLEHMASCFKRPVAALLLPRPPHTPPLPTDFRSLPNSQRIFAKETWLALRRARRLRSVAAELMQALGQTYSGPIGTASLDDDPEGIAVRERARLGVNVEVQSTWKDSSEALTAWRDTLERHAILTFQLAMPVENIRGFSLAEAEPFVIAISSKDGMNARVFTLFHEYGHLMMRSAGICLPSEGRQQGQTGQTERWCDHFAGAFLMPKHSLVGDSDCREFLDQRHDSERQLSGLSQRYNVSRLAVLTRLWVLGWLSDDRYARETKKLGVPRPTKGGRIGYASKVIREKGRLFTSLVLQAHEQNVVGYSEMADYLGVRLKHVEPIRKLLSV